MAKLDIILPTLNNEEYTIKLLDSIVKYTEDYRVIWIDNGSEKESRDKVEEAIKDIPHFKIYNDTNLGFVKAVNQGIATSTAPYICIQNNDTEVVDGWADKMIETFNEPQCGLVGPVCLFADSWQNVDNVAQHFGEIPDKREVGGMLAFFCTVIKREVIEKVGYLSEEYGLGFGDDDDYCERAKEAGYKLFLRGDVVIPHYHRTTFKKYIQDFGVEKEKNLAIFKAKWNK